MNVMTMKRLERLGFPKLWLEEVKKGWTRRYRGRYVMKIYDIEELDQEIETGVWIETTRFADEAGLNEIHKFFEGLGYVMTDTLTGEEIGRGIIDGSPFDEVSQVEGKKWSWL